MMKVNIDFKIECDNCLRLSHRKKSDNHVYTVSGCIT